MRNAILVPTTYCLLPTAYTSPYDLLPILVPTTYTSPYYLLPILLPTTYTSPYYLLPILLPTTNYPSTTRTYHCYCVQMINELPDKLQRDLVKHLYASSVLRVPLFKY
jgi:hypothetical protein